MIERMAEAGTLCIEQREMPRQRRAVSSILWKRWASVLLVHGCNGQTPSVVDRHEPEPEAEKHRKGCEHAGKQRHDQIAQIGTAQLQSKAHRRA